MKRYFFTLTFICVACGNSWGQTADQDAIREIKDFYVAYTTNMLADNSTDPIKEKYLTKSLIAKVDRIVASIGADPVIRAQDFVEEAIETLKVEHLNKNWYMVSYFYKYGGKTYTTNIPVRTNKTGGQFKIDYITPEWNGSLYGDSLLFDKPKQQLVDISAPLPFLKTFYATYVMEYCSLSENLTPRIKELREDYLTSDALMQFDAAVAKAKYWGSSTGYDALIDGFDFDRLWLPSLKFTKVDESTYQMNYTKGKTPCTVTLKVLKQGKGYRINGIKLTSRPPQ
ncbi:hypothetical protein FACS1894123_10450 [Bacteroidia bacterium]|nr:hypothetical protein FACS1894123_10450 [Bacteroidia bacterium]